MPSLRILPREGCSWFFGAVARCDFSRLMHASVRLAESQATHNGTSARPPFCAGMSLRNAKMVTAKIVNHGDRIEVSA